MVPECFGGKQLKEILMHLIGKGLRKGLELGLLEAEEPRPREEGRLLAAMNGQTLCSPIRTFKLQCFLLFSQRLPTLGTSLHGPDWVLGASILPLGGAQGQCLTDRPSRLLRMGEGLIP